METNVTEFTVRKRRSYREMLYGPFAPRMQPDSQFFLSIRDRAAYVYIVGNYPSHLRRESTAVLRHVTLPYQRPSALDGRVGTIKLNEQVAADLDLEQHPMVKEVRHYLRQGYVLLGSRGYAERNGYHSVYMFRPGPDGLRQNPIIVKLDGATKHGW